MSVERALLNTLQAHVLTRAVWGSPYARAVQDFHTALRSEGVEIANKIHKLVLEYLKEEEKDIKEVECEQYLEGEDNWRLFELLVEGKVEAADSGSEDSSESIISVISFANVPIKAPPPNKEALLLSRKRRKTSV